MNITEEFTKRFNHSNLEFASLQNYIDTGKVSGNLMMFFKEIDTANEKHIATLKLIHKALGTFQKIDNIYLLQDYIKELDKNVALSIESATKH